MSMRKFCERLKELRTDKGLSTKKLGELTGFGNSTISRWETGVNDITSDNLIILAKFFGVTVDFLLGLED